MENVERLKEIIQESHRGDDEVRETEVMWNEFKANISDAADKILREKKSYEWKQKMSLCATN